MERGPCMSMGRFTVFLQALAVAGALGHTSEQLTAMARQLAERLTTAGRFSVCYWPG